MSDFISKLKNAPGFVCLGPVNEKQVETAEKALNVKFAKEYTEYVKAYGAASFDKHLLTGVSDKNSLNVITITQAAREANPTIPDDMYVVEELHIDGILVWQNADGTVYISRPGTETRKEASSLQEYLKL